MVKQPARYSDDDDDDYVPSKRVKYSEGTSPTRPDKKHTLSSDEEDESHKIYELKQTDIDGQEDTTVTEEGETKITPFNMKEEMEDGCFDHEGFFHFKKNEKQIKDAWLDDVDWMKLRPKNINKMESSDSEEDNTPSKSDVFEIYKKILAMLREGESIGKALKRLGGNKQKLTTAQRLKLKKQGKLQQPEMTDFLTLTEFANQIMSTGNMDIYQETYEMINLKIKRHEKSEEPSYDMFGDDGPSTSKGKIDPSGTAKDSFDQVMWQFKRELSKDGEEDKGIVGPFTTEQMYKWQTTNHFKDGVYVRKMTEQDGPWYQSNRIDFEIYL